MNAPLQFFKKHPYILFVTCLFAGYILAAAAHGENALADVPVSIWTGLISSLVTIIGIGLTNEGNNVRLHRQLDHDRSIKTEDRLVTLRKEIYTKVIKSIDEMQDSFNDIARVEISELIRRRSDFHLNISHLQIVSTSSTSRIARLIGKLWTNLDVTSNNEINSLRNLWRDVAAFEDRANLSIEDYNNTLTLLKKGVKSATPEKLQKSEILYQDLKARFDEKNSNYQKEKNAFHEKIKSKIALSVELKKSLIKSIRSDFGIIDED